MNIKDYIQGKRHGREANQVEREAMNDPFLQDAIDGFDSVQGNHLSIIEDLERKIDKKSKKKILLIRYATISIAACVALLIGINLIFNQKKPNEKEYARVSEMLSEEVEHDTVMQKEIALNKARNFDKKVEINQTPNPAKSIKQKATEIKTIDNDVITNIKKTVKANDELAESINIVCEDEDDNIIVLPKTTSQIASATTTKSDKINTTNGIETKKLITGKVIDESGEPIVGASVYFDDKNGTITDLNGNFSLPKIDGQKIIVKYIGFQPKVVDINEDTNIIQLHTDNLALNEVVVTGYGRKTKKEVTGSVATVENKTISKTSGVQVKNENETQKFDQEEFRQFIFKNLKLNICEGIIFTLTASFKTDKAGKPYDVKIISSNCSEFEKEFLRIIQISPSWTIVNKKIIFTITKP